MHHLLDIHIVYSWWKFKTEQCDNSFYIHCIFIVMPNHLGFLFYKYTAIWNQQSTKYVLLYIKPVTIILKDDKSNVHSFEWSV